MQGKDFVGQHPVVAFLAEVEVNFLPAGVQEGMHVEGREL
jgi:hypothetical protein